MGAHPLGGALSCQGIAQYRPLCRIQRILHRYTLPIFPRHEAWYSFTAESTETMYREWLCLRSLLWDTVALEPTPSEVNRFRVGNANHCATQPVQISDFHSSCANSSISIPTLSGAKNVHYYTWSINSQTPPPSFSPAGRATKNMTDRSMT